MKISTKLILVVCFTSAWMFIQAQSLDWQWGQVNGFPGFSDPTISVQNVCTDANGTSYLVGRFSLFARFGSYELFTTGGWDVFVAAIDTDGNWLWAVKAGGLQWDSASRICRGGNKLYVTGEFESIATFGSTTLTSLGYADVFTARLDLNGNWEWAVRYGGTGSDSSRGICYDSEGFIPYLYVAGIFINESKVIKYNTSGVMQWSVGPGGTGTSFTQQIKAADGQNKYVCGLFYGTATFGSYTLTAGGDHDAFVAKLSPTGTWLWAQKAGGNAGLGSVAAYDLATDSSSTIYVTGKYSGYVYFGTSMLTPYSSVEMFVAKMDAQGNWLAALRAEGPANKNGTAIVVGNEGDIFALGQFRETCSFGPTTLTSYGEADVFLARLNPYTFSWSWAKHIASNDHLIPGGIAVDGAGNTYTAGSFTSYVHFPGRITLGINNQNLLYVAKLAPNPPRAPDNLNIAITGNHVQLNWDPVTHTVLGYWVTPDYYLVYRNVSGNPHGTYQLLGPTFNTYYTDSYVVLGETRVFYRVSAIKNYTRESPTNGAISIPLYPESDP